jgi:hypothetical protein
MTGAVGSADGGTIDVTGKGTIVPDHQGDAKGQGGRVGAVVVTDLLDQQDKLSLEGFFTHCRVQVL